MKGFDCKGINLTDDGVKRLELCGIIIRHKESDAWLTCDEADPLAERCSCKTQTLPPRLSCHKKVTILEVCFSAVAAILNSAWDLGERARRTVTPQVVLLVLERPLQMRPSENAKTPQRRFIR